MSEKSLSDAFRRMDRELERISCEKYALSKKQVDLGNAMEQLSLISNETQDCLNRLSVTSDESWRQELMARREELLDAQHESISALNAESEALGEKKDDLFRQEDACLLAYDKEKANYAREQESKKGSEYV